MLFVFIYFGLLSVDFIWVYENELLGDPPIQPSIDTQIVHVVFITHCLFDLWILLVVLRTRFWIFFVFRWSLLMFRTFLFLIGGIIFIFILWRLVIFGFVFGIYCTIFSILYFWINFSIRLLIEWESIWPLHFFDFFYILFKIFILVLVIC